MSTKTTFKRVALVAVAALGLGLLSVAPSSATAVSVQVTPSATTSAIKTGETATISLTVAAIVGAATDTITVHGVRTSGTSGTVNFNATTDSTTTRISDSAYATLASNAYTAGSINLDSATASNGSALRAVVQANFVAPSTAGTYEVTIYTTNKGSVEASSKVPFTWTITVTADSVNADTTSTNRMVSGYWTAVTDPVVDATVSAAKNASGVVATIKVVQKNATSTANEGMSVLISGPGFMATNTSDTSTASGTNRVLAISAPGVAAINYIKILSDGASGVTTVTVIGAKSGVVLASKTITFSDIKPATVSAVVKKAFIGAGLTTDKVFAVTVKDAAGNSITGSNVAVTGTRSDTTTAGKAIATAALSCGYDTTDKVYNCSATGTSASGFGAAGYTITATGTDPDATKVTTTASTTYSDIVATKVTISAPASAAIGDKITYTLTATEKNGYPVADGGYEGGTSNGSIGGIFWNTTTVPDYTSSSVTPFNKGETITTVSGVATKDIYMPVAAGSVIAKWTLAGSATAPVGAIDKSIAGTVITVETAVTNPGVDAASDAANEATDAANAATDAALAAADAADAATAAAEDASAAVATLAKSVNTALNNLKKQITALTALVNKLLKK